MPTSYIPTPLGTLKVHSRQDNTVTSIDWAQANEDVLHSPMHHEVLADELSSFFTGQGRDFKTKSSADIDASPFAQKVWAEISKIPFGTTVSYLDIANNIGSSARAVGGACGRNPVPLIVPCHRVVSSSGKLTGFSGGLGIKTKKALLELEKAKANNVVKPLWHYLRSQLPAKKFYYMRHGQTDYNLKYLTQGAAIDVPLNDTGISQAKDAVPAAQKLDFNTVYCSHMQRAETTAQIVIDGTNKDIPLYVLPTMYERDYGFLDGQDGRKFKTMHVWHTFAEGESWLEFVLRLFHSLQLALESEGTPLIVAHGAVFGALAELLGAGDAGERMENCSICSFTPAKNHIWALDVVHGKTYKREG